MSKMIWRIRLRSHLSEEQLQQSPYEIAKLLGMSKNTVRRYMMTDEELTVQLSASLGILARYFGLDEHDVIELIEVASAEDVQTKTQLPIPT